MLKWERQRQLEDEKKERSDIDRRCLARKRATEWLVFALNLINASLTMWVPFHVMTATKSEPLPSFGLTMATITLWMKLVSFIHVNWSLRQLHRIDDKRRWPGESMSGSEPLAVETDDMVYPKNLTARSFGYFLVAPTLCYQLSYPRSPRFRIRWLLRRVAMLSAGLGMMLFITEQYIEPTIDNSIKPLQDMDWLVIVERVLKLSLPTLYFWMAMFYTLFELWLNVLAELTRFGDREFYKAWWNSSTLSEYVRIAECLSVTPWTSGHPPAATVDPHTLRLTRVPRRPAFQVLEALESARSQMDASTRLLSDDGPGRKQVLVGHRGLLRERRIARGARGGPAAHGPGLGVLGPDGADPPHLAYRDAQKILQERPHRQRHLLDQFLLSRPARGGDPVLSRLSKAFHVV